MHLGPPFEGADVLKEKKEEEEDCLLPRLSFMANKEVILFCTSSREAISIAHQTWVRKQKERKENEKKEKKKKKKKEKEKKKKNLAATFPWSSQSRR